MEAEAEKAAEKQRRIDEREKAKQVRFYPFFLYKIFKQSFQNVKNVLVCLGSESDTIPFSLWFFANAHIYHTDVQYSFLQCPSVWEIPSAHDADNPWFCSEIFFFLCLWKFECAHLDAHETQARNSGKSDEAKEARRLELAARQAEKAEKDAAEAERVKVCIIYPYDNIFVVVADGLLGASLGGGISVMLDDVVACLSDQPFR